MLRFLRRLIPERSPTRLKYHKISAMIAAIWFRFPAKKMRVIAVTGTSGKSTTCELIWHILTFSGHKVGMVSGIQFHFPSGETRANETLRTSLRAWTLQKLLSQMKKEGATHVVVEVSSHAIDQYRMWGVPIDVAILTNTAHGEHMDYHDNFAEYVQTKAKLFHKASVSVINADDSQADIFESASKGKMIKFARKNASADLKSSHEKFSPHCTTFQLKKEKEKIDLEISLIGSHNLENVLAALAVASVEKVSLADSQLALRSFGTVPGRLESITEGQRFCVFVDHTYKPPALEAVLETLNSMKEEKLIVVWGGTGKRLPSFWEEAGSVLHKFADVIVLTTDDPYTDDPKKIAEHARKNILREEGEGFFEIEDRYEAIRYALFTAQKDDIVLIAGRGCERTQVIGKKVIPFDDREVVREILSMKK